MANNIMDTAASLRLSSVRLARLLRQHDGSGLSPSMASLAAMLSRHGRMTLGELAVREHVSKPSVTRIVEKLEAKGVLRKVDCDRDGRVTYAELTDAGRDMISVTRSRRTRWLADQMQLLTAEEQAALAVAAPILERLVELSGEESVS
jgi:DNA-binding MarR family transcriptional regulator